jgi:hypothetical protein
LSPLKRSWRVVVATTASEMSSVGLGCPTATQCHRERIAVEAECSSRPVEHRKGTEATRRARGGSQSGSRSTGLPAHAAAAEPGGRKEGIQTPAGLVGSFWMPRDSPRRNHVSGVRTCAASGPGSPRLKRGDARIRLSEHLRT